LLSRYGIGCDEKHSILDVVEYLGGQPILMDGKAGNRMDGELKTDKTKALGWSAKHKLQDYINEKLSAVSE